MRRDGLDRGGGERVVEAGRSFALRYRSVVASLAWPRQSRTNTGAEVRAIRLPAACRRPCRRAGRRLAAAQPRL